MKLELLEQRALLAGVNDTMPMVVTPIIEMVNTTSPNITNIADIKPIGSLELNIDISKLLKNKLDFMTLDDSSSVGINLVANLVNKNWTSEDGKPYIVKLLEDIDYMFLGSSSSVGTKLVASPINEDWISEDEKPYIVKLIEGIDYGNAFSTGMSLGMNVSWLAAKVGTGFAVAMSSGLNDTGMMNKSFLIGMGAMQGLAILGDAVFGIDYSPVNSAVNSAISGVGSIAESILEKGTSLVEASGVKDIDLMAGAMKANSYAWSLATEAVKTGKDNIDLNAAYEHLDSYAQPVVSEMVKTGTYFKKMVGLGKVDFSAGFKHAGSFVESVASGVMEAGASLKDASGISDVDFMASAIKVNANVWSIASEIASSYTQDAQYVAQLANSGVTEVGDAYEYVKSKLPDVSVIKNAISSIDYKYTNNYLYSLVSAGVGIGAYHLAGQTLVPLIFSIAMKYTNPDMQLLSMNHK